jgi:hypothetical protein
MRKFLKLTLAEDSQTVLVNSDYIIKVTCEEDDEYSTIVMSDEYSDIEVEETPKKIYTLLYGQTLSLDKKPEVPLPTVAPAVATAGPTIVTSEPNWDHHS